MKPVSRAPLYALIYEDMASVAREHGYALALHGTLARDLDVIAIPWTDAAVSEQEIADVLAERVALVIGGDRLVKGPFTKPHGRTVRTLLLTVDRDPAIFVDLSVMPRAAGGRAA